MNSDQTGLIDASRPPPLTRQREAPQFRPAGIETTPLQVLTRRKWAILAGAAVVTIVAALIVRTLPARYESVAAIVVDPRQLKVMSAESLMTAEAPDPMLLRTRMEELRSPQLARAVVEQLSLNHLPEYCSPPASLFERVIEAVDQWSIDPFKVAKLDATDGTSGCQVSIELATERLMRRVSGSADGRSFIIQLRAEASDPQLAARIANAYAAVFIVRRREQMQEIAQQAKIWLTTNASDLRDKMLAAASAVVDYRMEHGLASLHGETLTALSLEQINGQLSSVTAQLAAKQAALNQLTQIAQHRGNIEASTTAQASLPTPRLVEAYSALQNSSALLQARLGPAHPEVIASNAQLERARQQIHVEAEKSLATLSAEVQVQEADRTSLQAHVHQLQGEFTQQGEAEVRLHDLEREATLTRDLYSTLLTRLTQIQAEQSLQVADVRLAVEAQIPDTPFAPRSKMILFGTFLVALSTGTILALARDLLSRIFNDSDQVEEQTGLPVLGFFPLPGRGQEPQTAVLDNPSSLEAEAVYSVLARLTGNQFDRPDAKGQVIMITSSLPNEGKTSFCVALGRAASRAGLKAVVIDCDLRRPSLARITALSEKKSAPGPGRERRLFGEPEVDPRSRLHILPILGLVTNPHEAIASSQMPSIVARLRKSYDLIILDTPPVLAVSDAINLARLTDDVVLIVSWRKVTRNAVSAALKALSRSGALATSIVLSKVDLRRYSRGFATDTGLARPYLGYHAPPKLRG